MAKSERIILKGKLSWVNMRQNEWHKYSVVIFPDKESLDIIRELQARGLKNVLKKDPENAWFITFSRPHSKDLGKGEQIFGPPKVVMPDGYVLKPEDSRFIPNGSDGWIEVECYEHKVPGGTKKAVAARYISATVTQLAETTQEQLEPLW